MFPFPDVSTLRVFPMPEGQQLEFKEGCGAFTAQKKLETICGFLNGGGGYLVVGVRDNLKIVGVRHGKDLDTFLRRIDDIYHSNLIRPTPPVGSISYAMRPTAAGDICVITVAPVEKEHPFRMSDGAIIHRLLASNLRQMTADVTTIYTATELELEVQRMRQVERSKYQNFAQKSAEDYATLQKVAAATIQKLATTSVALESCQKLLFEKILAMKAEAELELKLSRRSLWCGLW